SRLEMQPGKGNDIGDIVLNRTREGERQQDRKDEDPKVRCLSEFLCELYIRPKATIYIGKLKVQVREPVLSLADPRWAPLSKKAMEKFLIRERVTAANEKCRINALMEECKKQARKQYSKIMQVREGTEEWKQ
ncbi:hypothetical protein PMAYCL1PPCAC_14637, partial [Pristionchus mayeri]